MITSLSTPTDNAPGAYKIFKAKSGNDLDQEYVNIMISGIKDAIAVIEKASTDYDDPDIHNLATSSLPDMRAHLDYLIDCQEKCDNM